MRAILVDDDNLNSELLSHLLQKYCREVEILGTAETIDGALELIALHKPDLLFLDIELHNRNAKELMLSIDLDNIQIILITAFEKYAVEMHKFPVVDYLLKPLLITDLMAAVHKANKNREQRKESSSNMVKQHEERYIALPLRDYMQVAPLDDIIRLEAKNNYSQVYTKENKMILTSRSMAEYEEVLPKNNFVRVHKSHIVNLKYVSKYIRSKNGSLILQDGTEVPISANRKKDVSDRILFT